MTHEIAKKYGLTETARQYCGCIEGEDQYGLFIDDLKAIGVMFSTLTSSYGKLENITFKTRQNLMDDSILRPYDGRPFQIMKTCYMVCAQGGRYRPSQQTPTEARPFIKRRFSARPTKKIGCQATLTVRTVKVFVGEAYKAKSPNYKYRSWECRKITERLKQDMKKSPPVDIPVLLEFHVALSPDDDHSHTQFTSKQNGIIHPRLREEIQNHVDNNVCSTKTVKAHLEEVVGRMFEGGDRPKPDRLNRCYYPNNEVIRFHIHRALFKVKKPRYDRSALESNVDAWRRDHPEDSFALRPGADDGSSAILFCHQTKWQRDLLARYGDGVSLLDATYKTARFDLPLFFVVAKTNSGYCVVGTFLVRDESPPLVSEALTQFKTWNPNWNPKYFMTDHSEATVNALETTFPSTTVYLCSFHRERAWHKWLMTAGNVSKQSIVPLTKHWRQIAASRNEEEYLRNLDALHNDKCYQKNANAQRYFAGEWLPLRHRWVAAYQSSGFVAAVNMNDGIESQNKMLRHSYVEHTKDNTLTDLIRAVVKIYLPDVLRRYCVYNARVEEGWGAELPEFLADRPVSFVDHVRDRFERAKPLGPANLNDMGEGVFYVRSETRPDEWYKVDLRDPSCLCEDFERWRFPCLHMCAIFAHTEWGFDSLPAEYRDSPYLTVDTDYTAVIATPAYVVDAFSDGPSPCPSPLSHQEEVVTETPEEPDDADSLRLAIRRNVEKLMGYAYGSNVPPGNLRTMHELSIEMVEAMRRLVPDEQVVKRQKRN